MFGESISDNFLGMREVVKCGTNLVPEWGSTKTKSQLFVRTWNPLFNCKPPEMSLSTTKVLWVSQMPGKRKGGPKFGRFFGGFPDKTMKT